MNHSQTQFWSVPSFELLQQLQTTPQGLKLARINSAGALALRFILLSIETS